MVNGSEDVAVLKNQIKNVEGKIDDLSLGIRDILKLVQSQALVDVENRKDIDTLKECVKEHKIEIDKLKVDMGILENKYTHIYVKVGTIISAAVIIIGFIGNYFIQGLK